MKNGAITNIKRVPNVKPINKNIIFIIIAGSVFNQSHTGAPESIIPLLYNSKHSAQTSLNIFLNILSLLCYVCVLELCDGVICHHKPLKNLFIFCMHYLRTQIIQQVFHYLFHFRRPGCYLHQLPFFLRHLLPLSFLIF